MLARCGGLPRNTRSPWGETHAQYRNSQFSKLVDVQCLYYVSLFDEE